MRKYFYQYLLLIVIVNMLGPERWWTILDLNEAERNFGGSFTQC